MTLQNQMPFEDQLVALYPKLLQYALSLARNISDARDLVQKTILRCLEKKGLFKVGSNLSAWAKRILRNLFFDEWRKRGREDVTGEPPEQIAPDDPLREIEFNEVHRFIRDELPTNLREVVLLSAQGQTSIEIGEFLEIPSGTVRRRLSEARSILAERFPRGDR